MSVSLNTVLFLFICELLSASAGPQLHQVTAQPGQTVTLSCEAPNSVIIAAVEWTRPDLQKYVYFQRGRRPLTQDQDPSYVDRVKLIGRMEDGDLSLILKNVTSNDKGTYECRYKQIERGRWRRAAAINDKPASVFELHVEGPTEGSSKSGDSGVLLPVTLIVLTALISLVGLAGFVGFVIYKKLKARSENNSDLPVDDPDVLQQLQENETGQKHITLNTADIQV
ncbi:myelin-oligodendrocyte glycoprotein-like [Scomber scombrus]|uniref:myelin-oligodendrocyte glycoprotein-like n=1 Tax=Scomber scombrus TaxID=13677 RepID=UPI002DDB7B39|nr:myelin-oligodendrocyte glycoprotein-like [Scomber scombrus]